MLQKQLKGENRTADQIREHYEIEKELAAKLKNAPREERRHLYSSLYDELYKRVPHHPQLTNKSSPEDKKQKALSLLKYIKPFLSKDTTYLEVGPGDCALSFEAAEFAKQVHAVDVSDEITKSLNQPENFNLVLSDGCSVPLPPDSVNVAFSNQLMEHLHPDDAFAQLKNIYNVLVPGGVYICFCPNRLNGPHDISLYYDDIATGFHLKEYTNFELSGLFKKAGFSKVKVCTVGGGVYFRLPGFLIFWYEKFLDKLPYALRKLVVKVPPFGMLLDVQLIGIK